MLAIAEPTFIGEPVALGGCIALLGTAGLMAIISAQLAPDVAQEVERSCNYIEELYTKGQRTNPGTQLFPFPSWPNPIPKVTETPEPKWILYHYSDQAGVAGIVISQAINPSLADDERAAFGHGQYFTDISPIEAASGSAGQLSRAIFNMPWLSGRVTHYVMVNVAGLPVINVSSVYSQTYGGKYIYLNRSETPLSIQGRLENWGAVPFIK